MKKQEQDKMLSKKTNSKPLSEAKVGVKEYRRMIKRGKKNGGDANGLTRSILTYLSFRNWYGVRINTQGQWDDKLKIWKKSHTRKGTADIHACIHGLHVSIEIKTGNDRMRSDQHETKKLVEKAGGYYVVVSCFEDFIVFLKQINISDF